MGDPCSEKERIGGLTKAVEFLTDSYKNDQEMRVETLRTLKLIAQQGEQIQSLLVRQTSMEKDVDEIYPRLREVEETSIKNSAFIEQHEKDKEESHGLTNLIKGGVAVAVILAVMSFLLFLAVDKGYHGADTAPLQKQGGRK